jgi:hypothetical protein
MAWQESARLSGIGNEARLDLFTAFPYDDSSPPAQVFTDF